MSVVTRLHAVEISSPVLKSSTSSQVHHLPPSNGFGSRGSSPITIADTRQLERGFSPISSHLDGYSSGQQYSSSPRSSIPSPLPPQDAGLGPNRQGEEMSRSPMSSGNARDGPISSPQHHATGFVIPVSEGITEDDINQVELFYRGQKTEVHVCKSLTNMYLSAAKPAHTMQQQQDRLSKNGGLDPTNQQVSQSPTPSDIAKDEWDFSQTGIPVLVLDTGEHRRGRRLRLVLAEKGTGFTLWQDEIMPRTRYLTPHTNFHTITISTDSTRLVGFSFDEGKAATEFAEVFRTLTESPEANALGVGKKNSKKKKEKKPKFKPPRKIDISQPCCFMHVTKLERPDLAVRMFPPPPSGVELDRLGIPRAASESSGLSEGSTNPSEY